MFDFGKWLRDITGQNKPVIKPAPVVDNRPFPMRVPGSTPTPQQQVQFAPKPIQTPQSKIDSIYQSKLPGVIQRESNQVDWLGKLLTDRDWQKRAENNARLQATNEYIAKTQDYTNPIVKNNITDVSKSANQMSQDAQNAIKNTKTAVNVMRYIPGAGIGEWGANMIRQNFDTPFSKKMTLDDLISEQQNMNLSDVAKLSPEEKNKLGMLSQGMLGVGAALDIIPGLSGVKQIYTAGAKNLPKIFVKDLIKETLTKQGVKKLAVNSTVGGVASSTIAGASTKLMGGTNEQALQSAGQSFLPGVLGGVINHPYNTAENAARGVKSIGNVNPIIKQADDAHINMANALDNSTDPVARQSIINDMKSVTDHKTAIQASEPVIKPTQINNRVPTVREVISDKVLTQKAKNMSLEDAQLLQRHMAQSNDVTTPINQAEYNRGESLINSLGGRDNATKTLNLKTSELSGGTNQYAQLNKPLFSTIIKDKGNKAAAGIDKFFTTRGGTSKPRNKESGFAKINLPNKLQDFASRNLPEDTPTPQVSKTELPKVKNLNVAKANNQAKKITPESQTSQVKPIELVNQTSQSKSTELPVEVKAKIDDLVSSSKLSPSAYNDALDTPLSQVLGDMKAEADVALPTFNAVAASGKSRSGRKLVDAINQDSVITKAAVDAQQTGKEINFFAKKDKNGRSVGIERFDPKTQKIEAGFVTDQDGNILGNHIKVDETGIQVNVGGELVNLNRVIGNPNDWSGKYRVSETMSRNIDANAPTKEIAQQTKDFVIGGKVKAESNFKTELNTEYSNLKNRIKTVGQARPSNVSKKVYEDDIFSVLNGDKTDAQIKSTYDPNTSKVILDYKAQTRGLYDSLLERVNKERVKFGQEPIEPRQNYITHLQELSNSKSFIGEVASGLKNSFADEGMQTTRGGVPGNIAGRTEQFKPTSAYNKFMQARKGTKSLRDPFLAVQEYLEPALYNIHMTEPTVRARAVESAFRTASELKNYSGDKTIRDFNGFVKPYQVGGDNAKLVAGFQEYANALAKKTNRFDRPIIDASAATAGLLKGSQVLQRIGGRGTVIGNASSVLSQALGQPVAIADAGIKNYIKGIAKSVGGDKAILQSPFINARKTQVTKPIRGLGTKIMDAGGVPLQRVELGFVELTWNTQHAKALSKGYKGIEAVKQADFNTERLVSGRGIADKPEIYRSTAANNLLQYTLEVAAQYKAVIKDFSPAQKATFVVAAFAMNQAYQLATGTQPLPDFLGAAIDTTANLADQQDTTSVPEKLLTGGKRFLGESVKMNPFASVAANTLLSQDQRKQFFGSDADVARYEGTSAPVQVVRNAYDAANYATQGNWAAARDTGLKVVPFGNQIRKTIQGAEANSRGYGVDKAGNPTYATSTDPLSQIRNVLFGPSADPNAVNYYKNNNVSLTDKQTETLKTLPKNDQLDYLKQITDTRAVDKQTDKEVKVLGSSDAQTKTLTTGEVAYKDNDGKWTTAKDQYTADKAIAKQKTDKIKDAFDQSGSNFLEQDGYIYTRNDDGTPKATPKIKFEHDLGTATLAQYKADDDINNWVTVAKAQAKNIAEQLNNSNVNPIEAINLKNEFNSLISNIAKYSGYGGFTKPKSGSSSKANIASVLARSKAISDTTSITMNKLNDLLMSTKQTKPTIRKAQLKTITVKGASK